VPPAACAGSATTWALGGEQIATDGEGKGNRKGKGGPELADVDRFLSYVDTVRATSRG
jgi:hypothetical protein